MSKVRPLERIDIVLTVFNQEEIIERVLHGIFRNTTTPFNLILIFDGCNDHSKERSLVYIKKVKPYLMEKLISHDTPNLFELRANNFGFRLAETAHIITLQDDMIIQEYGWERRLTYPLRRYDDILAVSGRASQDVKHMGNGIENYSNIFAMETDIFSDQRNVFAIRDVCIRGPVALRNDYLKQLGYLNDRYAPGALDDAEISLRAWLDRSWKVGAFWVKYLSKKEWSKVNAPDSTMKAWESCSRNRIRLYEDFKEYLDSGIKHDEDIRIGKDEIDYINGRNDFLIKSFWMLRYPIRFDKRRIKTLWNISRRMVMIAIKFPIIHFLGLFLGKKWTKEASESGFKDAIKNML